MSTTSSAAAASVHQSELLLFFTLLQLTAIVLAGRIGGALATRVRQSPAVGEIIVGILLGPSLLGLLAPDVFHYVFRSASSEPLQVLSQIGLILLMFQIGLEFDFGHLTDKRNRRAVAWISTACMVLPFGLAWRWVSSAPRFFRPAPTPWRRRCSSARRCRSRRCRSSDAS